MAVQARPEIEAYVGMTGSGKGVSIERRLAELRPPRLLIWDPRDEYGDHGKRFDSLKSLVDTFGKAGAGSVRARYVFNGRGDIETEFGIVCGLAFAVGNVTLLAEEISDVTKPSYAPPRWRRCITQGRHRGMRLIAATQRPALIDKTFLSSATIVRCCMLGYAEDQAAMARELGAPVDAVAALTTDEVEGRTVINYLEKLRRSRELYAGQITLSGGKVREKRAIYGQAV
jgi:hypothetical protein